MRYYTVKQAAKILGISIRGVGKQIEAGHYHDVRQVPVTYRHEIAESEIKRELIKRNLPLINLKKGAPDVA